MAAEFHSADSKMSDCDSINAMEETSEAASVPEAINVKELSDFLPFDEQQGQKISALEPLQEHFSQQVSDGSALATLQERFSHQISGNEPSCRIIIHHVPDDSSSFPSPRFFLFLESSFSETTSPTLDDSIGLVFADQNRNFAQQFLLAESSSSENEFPTGLIYGFLDGGEKFTMWDSASLDQHREAILKIILQQSSFIWGDEDTSEKYYNVKSARQQFEEDIGALANAPGS